MFCQFVHQSHLLIHSIVTSSLSGLSSMEHDVVACTSPLVVKMCSIGAVIAGLQKFKEK